MDTHGAAVPAITPASLDNDRVGGTRITGPPKAKFVAVGPRTYSATVDYFRASE